MHYSKPIDTPIEKCLTLIPNECSKIDQKKERIRNVYGGAARSLMYAMLYTQLDICFAVGLVSRYQNNLGPTHWKVVKIIMRFLHGATELVLCFKRAALS